MLDLDLVSLFNTIDYNSVPYISRFNVETVIINPLAKYLDDYIISSHKVALIFKNYLPTSIIKIPLSNSTFLFNYFFYNSITPEINLYQFFIDNNILFKPLFKPYTLLSTNLKYPIYKQERVTTLSSSKISHDFTNDKISHLEEILLNSINENTHNAFTLNGLPKRDPLLLEWYVQIIEQYGTKFFNSFLTFLQSQMSFLDIGHNNIGYDKDNKPCIIDYTLH